MALAETVQSKTRKKPSPRNQAWYSIKNLTSDTTEVYVYEDIGEWGVTASDFIAEWTAIGTPKINLRINSKGGSVFDGTAIFNAIKNHPAYVTSIVDGVAASAASFIAMAADRVEMEKMSRMMIHDAGVGGFYAEGNPAQLREAVKDLEDLADLLDDLSNMIAQVYVDKAGGTVEEWRALMASDKWYSAEQAVEAGLADGIHGEPAKSGSGSNSNKEDLETQESSRAAHDQWDVEGLFATLKGAFA